MTLAEVIKLIDSTRWGWWIGDEYALKDTGDRHYYFSLAPDGYPDGFAGDKQRARDTFSLIGCSIVSKDSVCAKFNGVYVGLFDGKVYTISVKADWNMDSFASFVIEYLTNRYGKPNESKWKKGASVFCFDKPTYLAQWKSDSISVVIYYFTHSRASNRLMMSFELPDISKEVQAYEKQKADNPSIKPEF